jgi:type VI secretion system secreted protein VgrG
MDQILRLTLDVEDASFEVIGLEGEEAISSPFRFFVDVAPPADAALQAAVAGGATATLSFIEADIVTRRIHGMVWSVRRRVAVADERPIYRLELVPRLCRATLVETQQIFMNLSVPGVIAQKLALIGLEGDDVSLVNLGSYPIREFIVQYRESDLAFCSRLAEHVGISYYFEHGEQSERLIFSDGPGGFGAAGQVETIRLAERVDAWQRVQRLDVVERVIPSNIVVYDYNYRRPDLDLVARSRIESGHGGGIVEYGGHTKTDEESAELARIRAEEILSKRIELRGESTIVNLCAGGHTLIEAPPAATGLVEDTPVLIAWVRHELCASGDGPARYRNEFVAHLRDHCFRPSRRTPRPRIHGYVTAVVQGLPGAVGGAPAALDEEGRYVVQFHFDGIFGSGAARTSRPVRMAQPFGGTGHGMHFPLRPGTEVLVAFADGDPDRPVILGAIPNVQTRTPVTARNSTQNRITTASGALFEISERK